MTDITVEYTSGNARVSGVTAAGRDFLIQQRIHAAVPAANVDAVLLAAKRAGLIVRMI